MKSQVLSDIKKTNQSNCKTWFHIFTEYCQRILNKTNNATAKDIYLELYDVNLNIKF